MKIAVTYENGTVFQHFGHTEQFKVYQVEDGRVTGTEILDTNGSGHGALAGFLQDAGVEALICGGLGMGARNALAQAGVTLYAGVTGDADAAVQALLANRLAYGTEDRHMPVPDLFLSPFPACQGMTGRAIRGTIRINALL